MSSDNEKTGAHCKDPAQPDLSAHYHEIGIKAVAAALHGDAEHWGDASGDHQENQRQKKRTTENARG